MSPENEFTKEIERQILHWRYLWKEEYGYYLSLNIKYFETQEEMFEYVRHPEYMEDVHEKVGLCFGISYEKGEYNEHVFNMHFDDQDQSDY